MMRSRVILWTMLVVALALALAACGPAPAQPAPSAPVAVPTQADTAPTAAPAATEPSAAPAGSGYHEAPMLAEMVAAGTLPPVGERLPGEPMIVTPFDAIGKYGGTRMAVRAPWIWTPSNGFTSRIRHSSIPSVSWPGANKDP